jgi:hypothetical protein
MVERALYLILRDCTLRELDPAEVLLSAVVQNGFHRLRAARTLTTRSAQLHDVPEAARSRFFELINALPDTAAGTNEASAFIALVCIPLCDVACEFLLLSINVVQYSGCVVVRELNA